MAMERQDYPAMLPQLQPPQAVSILNDRVSQIGRVNVAIADWLQERRRIEEQYAAGLRRLAQRNLEGVDLGVFSVPWSHLTGSADTLAESHSALATKIEVDVERPLREFVSFNREMTAMSTVQGNLGAMAKDVEKAQSKTDKLKGKGERAEAGKVANANSDLDDAQTRWESQAPYIFENLQALDETRLTHLRDVLTQYQTHEVDQVERSRITAEQCLNVLLNVETTDEIKTFAIRALQNKPTLTAVRQNSAVGTPSRAIQSSSSYQPPGAFPDDSLNREISNTPTDEKSKSRLKGLKRMSTFMGRKNKQPAALASSSETSEVRPRASPFNSFRPNKSRDNAPTLSALQETPSRERPRSPLRLGSEIFQPSFDPPSPEPASRSVDLPQTNGTSSSAALASTLAALNGSHVNDLADLEPPKPVAQEPIQTPPAVAESSKDSEGFSVPPPQLDPISQAQQDAAEASDGVPPQFNVNIRDKPIDEASGNNDAALASVANKLSAPPTTSRRTGTVRGRRQDRNSTIGNAFASPEQPISELGPSSPAQPPKEIAEPAPIQTDAPAVQLNSSVLSSASALTQSPAAAFAPLAASTFSPFSSQAEQASASASASAPHSASSFRPDSRTANLDHTRTDSQSIRSSTTTGSQGASKHPELDESGLNSSIIETVSARFENGKLASSSLVGEIALVYNPADFSSPFGTESIRLENFSSLEKVAPNPAFVTQIPEKEGEYTVNLSNIAKTQVAFKYQVRLDDKASQAPLLITPAFKIEASQCSVIVSYALNPAFALQGRDSITLSNVTLALSIEGAKASSCQSRPVGTFSRDKNLIFWQLNDITLTASGAPQKLLARFATDAEAKGGSVEAKWEISGETAQGLGSGLSVSAQHTAGAVDGSDPFADESANQAGGGWKSVQGVRKLGSGSYVAK